MLKEEPLTEGEEIDPYKGIAYQTYRWLLQLCLQNRWTTVGIMLAALIASIIGFGQVKQAFFPASSLPMFMVEYWLPQGSDIRAVHDDIQSIERNLKKLPDIEQVTATIGRGAERFMLTYAPEFSYPSYAQLIVRVKSFDQVQPTINAIDQLDHVIATAPTTPVDDG